MSQEQHEKPPRPRPEVEFGLTDRERLFDRVSHDRLLGFLNDETTTVHRLEASHNNYGEFLFVWTSKPGQERRIWMTFYGLGYHEQRERWVTEEWFWYRGNPLPENLQQDISREEAVKLVQERLKSISPYAGQQEQSQRGKLFEMLADLTDEDGAYSEMQDLDYLAGRLFDDEN